MKRILITGANSFVGTAVEQWLSKKPDEYTIDTIDTIGNKWREIEFGQYDIVFHVAGIAHVDPKPEMAPLYYKVNRDLAIEIARHAKGRGVYQFIFMSSMIVYHASKSLNGTVIDSTTQPLPNDFYGDSKLQAENGLRQLESDTFKVAILRPCMIYGTNGKGNFNRLVRLSKKVPVFPSWHNKRSMIYIDNLCEFVKQAIDRQLSGIFHLQNRELADTVEICKHYNPKLICLRILNPIVWCCSFVFKPLCKMFASQYYTPDLTTYDFEYQLISFKDSLSRIDL